MRFESKHSYFKKVVRVLGNFINVTKTMAERHQLLQAYYSHGCLFEAELEVSKHMPYETTVLADHIREATSPFNFDHECTFYSYECAYKGTTYKKDMCLLLRYGDGGLIVGKIIFCIIQKNDLYFVVTEHETDLCSDLGLYLVKSVKKLANCVKCSDILDYYPLQAYTIGSQSYVTFKHQFYLSF